MLCQVWLYLSFLAKRKIRRLMKGFFVALRMTKLSFVIGEFISGWSHGAWIKIMPCGSLRNERANDIANIE